MVARASCVINVHLMWRWSLICPSGTYVPLAGVSVPCVFLSLASSVLLSLFTFSFYSVLSPCFISHILLLFLFFLVYVLKQTCIYAHVYFTYIYILYYLFNILPFLCTYVFPLLLPCPFSFIPFYPLQCCIDNELEMAEVLMEHNVDMNARDIEGWTPLHAAAATGNIQMINLLVNEGASLVAINNDDKMPIDVAADGDIKYILQQKMTEAGACTHVGRCVHVADFIKHWYIYTGTYTLAHIHWYIYTGTYTLVHIHWYIYTGTYTLAHIHWYIHTVSCF